jgi:hypothetical protein
MIYFGPYQNWMNEWALSKNHLPMVFNPVSIKHASQGKKTATQASKPKQQRQRISEVPGLKYVCRKNNQNG